MRALDFMRNTFDKYAIFSVNIVGKTKIINEIARNDETRWKAKTKQLRKNITMQLRLLDVFPKN